MSRRTPECSSARHRARRALGFALVPVLFLIVVVAALAAVALRVSVGQQQTVTIALQQSRALAAARAGIDWAAYLAVNGNCQSGTLHLSEASLSGFTVTVTCTAASFTDGNGSYQSYTIASTATWGSYGSPEFVQRMVRATFTNET